MFTDLQNLDYNYSPENILQKLFLINDTLPKIENKLPSNDKTLINLYTFYKIDNFNFNKLTPYEIVSIGRCLAITYEDGEFNFYIKPNKSIKNLEFICTSKNVNKKLLVKIINYYDKLKVRKMEKTRCFYNQLTKVYKNILEQT